MKLRSKISAFIRLHNAENTVKACIKSVIDFVDEVVVVDNLSKDGGVEIVKSLNHPKIKLFSYPHNLAVLGTQEAIDLPVEDPHSWASLCNFCQDQCANDWILKVDSDQVFTDWGWKRILSTDFKKPFLGFCGYEVVSPTHRTRDFFTGEPRLWCRHLGGGTKFIKCEWYGHEAVRTMDCLDATTLGPYYEELGKGPHWLHYGWTDSCQVNRSSYSIATVPLDVSHHPDIVPNLHKIFNQ